MEKIIVVGGGGHAKVVISLLKKISGFDVLGYVDQKDHGPILGVKYLGDDDGLKRIKADHRTCRAAIGIGSIGLSDKRRDIRDGLKVIGFELPAIISPAATVDGSVRIGDGTVVCDGAVIAAGTSVGQCAIINTHSCIDHDCSIGDFVHVGPGATVCGGVAVGTNSMVGAGSTIVQYKKIGDHCLIGAGATVIGDCLEPGTYVGTPAVRKDDEKFSFEQ